MLGSPFYRHGTKAHTECGPDPPEQTNKRKTLGFWHLNRVMASLHAWRDLHKLGKPMSKPRTAQVVDQDPSNMEMHNLSKGCGETRLPCYRADSTILSKGVGWSYLSPFHHTFEKPATKQDAKKTLHFVHFPDLCTSLAESDPVTLT